ncbi:MAG TPA: methyltransferase, partial [Ilumatobacteraceae bacterium]|nr:methyltransferase [Ilumatobacteraceae bacterium]
DRLDRAGDLVTPHVVRMAATLGLAEHVAAGADDVATLAAAAGVDPARLARVLPLLVGADVLTMTGDRVGLGELGVVLAESEHATDELRHSSLEGRTALAAAGLVDFVRSGVAPHDAVFGTDFWTGVRADAAGRDNFEHELAQWARHWVPLVADRLVALVVAERSPEGSLDGAAAPCIADIGGGCGDLLVALGERIPGANGVLVELDEQLPAARRRVGESAAVDRIELVAGDFFGTWPEADVYVLAQVVHDWPDEAATAILRRAGEALRADPTRRVVIVERDARHADASDVQMLLLFASAERSDTAMRTIAASAGIDLAPAVPIGAGFVAWVGRVHSRAVGR